MITPGHHLYSPYQALQIATQMINKKIFTKQTGERGRLCSKVVVAERLYSRREYYLAILMDRDSAVSLAWSLWGTTTTVKP